MILTCPNCATRYEADAAKFLPDGRKVRCAKCGHTWHQVVPAPEAIAGTAADQAVLEAPALSVQAPPKVVPDGPSVAEVRSAVVDKQKAGTGWRAGALTGWAALIVVLALLSWTAVKFRQEIVSIWPQTATFYAAVGMDVNSVGLAFQDVSYRVTSEDDQPILHIKGTIINITQRELAVPQIHAALTDEDRRDLFYWKIDPGARNLSPGKTTTFSARVPSPPSGARHVDLKFVKG